MSDARVDAAVAHWGPRLISNGVDCNDFVRVTASITRWDDWLDAWCSTAHAHVSLAIEAREAGRQRTAGEAYLRAAVCFHFAKFVWVLDSDRNRAATLQAVQALYDAHALLGTGAERIEAVGGVAVGNLRLPGDRAGAPPLVVLIPGLDSTKEEFFAWESVFLARGMATLSIDGPGQGESGFASSLRPDYEVAVSAMLDSVGARRDVDLGRVGAAGVSLGGYYVVRAAAFEPRLRAIASVSGPYDMAGQWGSLPPLTREAFRYYGGAASEGAARALASELTLAGVAPRVTQPCLVVTGRQDRVIGWEQTKRIADSVTGCRWVLFDEGTHVCNNIPYRYRPLVADWMRETLG